MRFCKQTDERTGKSYAYLNLEGVMPEALASIPKEQLDELLSFRVSTYQRLRTNSSMLEWEIVFGVVHRVLQTFTDEEKARYATTIVVMHHKVLQVLGNPDTLPTPPELTQMENDLAHMWADFDRSFETPDNPAGLWGRLVAYTSDNVPIRMDPHVGERPQDSEAMTFYQPDVIKLTAVAIMCKLLTPIFGVMCTYYPRVMDSIYKELHCSVVMREVLIHRCPQLREKLQNYIANNARNSTRATENLTREYNGLTATMINLIIYAAVLVRRFITADLYNDTGNLMTFVNSCIRDAAKTQSQQGGSSKGGNGKITINPITPTIERSGGGDDGNLSSLEDDTQTSSKTADFPFLIKAAVHELIPRFTMEHELDLSILAQAKEYYLYHHLSLTPINTYVLGLVFGSYLCGAKSVEAIGAESLAELIPVLQLFLIKQNYLCLAEAVSLTPTGVIRQLPTGNDQLLRNQWSSTLEYRNCNSRYEWNINNTSWDSALKNIVEEDITKYRYAVNTAPVFAEMLPHGQPVGQEYLVAPDLAREICLLITQLYP